jgi:N-acetyl-1-D-myo-inositol-2-amino-2-deoxy-alpha-D-glucopyranoside deacetylase
MTSPSRRLLLVHAHPDDESIATGATMARYAAEGAQVTLLTCTLGEEGEILTPALAQLAVGQADQLGGYRIGELAAAMRELGITDHRFLGGAGRFRDSGMIDTPANDGGRAFWRAGRDLDIWAAAVLAVVEVIREVRPQVVATYDPDGDYGHPDHIMAHRVTTEAVSQAGDAAYGSGEPWSVRKLYWTVAHSSDEQTTTVIDGSAYCGRKLAALAAHRTQIVVDGRSFALSNEIWRDADPIESYRLAAGELGPDRDADGNEADLFSGVGE